MKRAFVHSVSCLARHLDALAIKKFLSENNWKLVDDYKKADLILIGTCGATERREDMSISAITRFDKGKKSGSVVIVFGCLPSINEERIKSVFDGILLNLQSIENLNEILNAGVSINRFGGNILEKKFLKARLIDRLKGFYGEKLTSDAYHITLSIGCLGNCSYCTIKNAIGELKSRPIDEIICEFDTGLKLGYKRFILCASDTGAYGLDIKTNIVALLKEILKREGDYKISLTYFNPKWWKKFGSNMTELFKSGEIDFISLPVQSGSNKILRLMNRGYTVEEFEECAKNLKNANPNLTIITDMMCGFPSETEEEFKQTLNLLDNELIDRVLPTVYSERPKTKDFPEEMKVPHYIKKSREIRLYIRFYWKRIRKYLRSL